MRRRRSASSLRQVASASARAVVIAHVDQQRAVAEYLGQRARPGRDHGHAGAHGLQRREAEPLVEGGEGQHAARESSAARSGCCSPAGADDPVAHRPTRQRPTSSACSPHPGGPARTRATSGWRSATAPKARTSPGRSFRGSAVPIARQKRSMPGGRNRRSTAAASASAGTGRSGMPGLTTRTREGSASNASTTSRATKAESVWTHAPRSEGAPDQPGVGERRRIAQLGMVQRREVVHRDHGGGPAGGGHQEVRPVHDVGGADEPFERWEVPAGPQRVQRAGRHGPLARRDARRQLRLDQPPAAPADGIGPHVDSGALRQGGQCAVAERPDARGEPEQRRCVERDAQARRCRGPGRVGRAQVVIAPSMERIAPVM